MEFNSKFTLLQIILMATLRLQTYRIFEIISQENDNLPALKGHINEIERYIGTLTEIRKY